jgi:fermentation-respiration switch protein FrsA (DUF1100 family)
MFCITTWSVLSVARRIVGTEAVTSWMTTDALANAHEPKEQFWVKGATHVALYDKDECVTPAVSKLGEFFRTKLTVG